MRNINLKRSILPLVIFLGLLVTSESMISQTQIAVVDSTSQKPNKLKFGVGFGLSFVGGTNISLAPNLIYNVSEKFAFGGGVQVNYLSIKDLRTTTTFGGNVIGQYRPAKILTTLIEFTELNVSSTTETPEGEVKETFWDSALFVGAGLNITEKVSVGAKYNLLYKEDESVYTSPVIPFVNISF